MITTPLREVAPAELEARLDAALDEYSKIDRSLELAAKRPTAYSAQQITEWEERKAVLLGEARVFGAEYHARRWNRFYLVPGGKVHSTTNCSSCNHFIEVNGKQSQTQFVLLAADSGRMAAGMVEEYGSAMCTVCFPDAPLDAAYLTAGRRGQADLDAKEARRSELAAKAAAKEANTPRDLEGKPLRLSNRDTPSTIRGASNAMAYALNSAHWYRATGEANGTGPHPEDATWVADATLCAGAIARHEGLDGWQDRAEALLQAADAKAAKKAASDLRKAQAQWAARTTP